jgi:hypothetical protein
MSPAAVVVFEAMLSRPSSSVFSVGKARSSLLEVLLSAATVGSGEKVLFVGDARKGGLGSSSSGDDPEGMDA